MSCVAPITIKQNGQEYKVPCGQCMQCRIKKQQEIIFLCSKELQEVYKKGQGASFITLTYNEINIPTNKNGKQTLRKTDLQKFIKRIRRMQDYHKDPQKWKYIACGEYGDQYARPHYHIAIIGLSQEFAKMYTKKQWKYGLIQVGTLSAGGLRYILKYCTKNKPTTYIKALYNSIETEPPFLIHSQNLAKKWLDKETENIAENEFCYNVNKKKLYIQNT